MSIVSLSVALRWPVFLLAIQFLLFALCMLRKSERARAPACVCVCGCEKFLRLARNKTHAKKPPHDPIVLAGISVDHAIVYGVGCCCSVRYFLIVSFVALIPTKDDKFRAYDTKHRTADKTIKFID